MSNSAVQRLVEELSRLTDAEVSLERPMKPEHGDYATNVALQLAPARRRPPRELAEELATAGARLDVIERAEVAGPGFVNLWLTPAWFGEALGEILETGEAYGGGFAQPKERIQVEMVSANPTGPITVASARNGAYGDSVARLLEFAGHTVEREYYFNDAGRQVEQFRASIEALRRGESPPEDGYQGAYLQELAQLDGDPVLAMFDRIKQTLERFRIQFDTWKREVELFAEVPGVLEQLDSYEAQGTLWARTTTYGDDKDRPLLRSEDGSYLYFARDVAYVRDKFERGFDRAMYVLGADHHGYVARLTAAAAMLGYDTERLEVLIYQLVHLTRGGELAKMSKRRGDVVFLDELIDEIGVDAARWYLVSRGHDQTIEIDVDLAAERSQKNPVYYVQYVHARMAGIERNAEGAEASPEPPAQLSAEERDLIKRLADFPRVVAEATERRAPHSIAVYAIYLADDFHRFYHDHRVLGSDSQAFRLALVRATRTVVARCLQLIGVEAPDQM